MAILDIFNKKTEKKKTSVKPKKTAKEKEVVLAEKMNADEVTLKNEEKSETKSVATGKEKKKTSDLKIRPIITEKAFALQGRGVYVFEVKNNVNRVMVRNYIRATYKVTPVKVNILNTSNKSMIFRRRRSVKPGYKKAMVFLKEGETISVK